MHFYPLNYRRHDGSLWNYSICISFKESNIYRSWDNPQDFPSQEGAQAHARATCSELNSLADTISSLTQQG